MEMKNYEEIIKALLDGETLQNILDPKWRVKLKEGELSVDTNGVIPSFSRPDHWQIYTDHQWHNNIPEGGILCWVSDGNEEEKWCAQLVKGKLDDKFLATKYHQWRYATPVKQEDLWQGEVK
jgi:hypothetical protein